MTYPGQNALATASIGPMTINREITQIVRRMKDNARRRDDAMNNIRLMRRGEASSIWPDSFSERYPVQLVANFVDTAARDMASSLSPLPSLVCSAGAMKTNKDKQRAERMNRIGMNYWNYSKLERQMKYGADQYVSYGFFAMWVEADYDEYMPFIHVEDPYGSYYDMDRYGVCHRYAKCWREDVAKLCVQFPEAEYRIRHNEYGEEYAANDTEVIRYIDDSMCIAYLPERGGIVLTQYSHGLDFCPVKIGERPGIEQSNPRGQFDDVLYVQLAYGILAQLTLEAAHKSVQAPLTIPSDVNELSIGADSVIVTDQPDKVQRVPLQVPPAAFSMGAMLHQEMMQGAGYPETRLGQSPAGGTTGRGVQALEGGYDQQIRLGQDILAECLRDITDMCFKMDAQLWPKKSKTIRGHLSGESFELSYVPGKDMGSDVVCDVTYGFASGLSPNAAIVTMLQMRGDELIGRDTVRRNLPFDIDPEHEQREIDVQQIEDGMKQGLAAALTAVPQMLAQGLVQPAMQLIQAATTIAQGREQGLPLTDLFAQAFQQPEQQQPPQMPGQPGPPGAEGLGGAPGQGPDVGLGPDGLPEGTAYGQAGMNPGGRPSVADLSAGFRSGGQAIMSDTVRRRIATG